MIGVIAELANMALLFSKAEETFDVCLRVRAPLPLTLGAPYEFGPGLA